MPPINPLKSNRMGEEVPLDTKPFRVHVTGFGPFGQHTTNPSWQIAHQLNRTTLHSTPQPLTISSNSSSSSSSSNETTEDEGRDGSDSKAGTNRTIEITSSLIPVTYHSALTLVPLLHQSTHPLAPQLAVLDDETPPPPPSSYDLIIHIGVGAPHSMTLENRARKSNYQKFDVDHRLAPLDPKSNQLFDKKREDEDDMSLKEQLKTRRGFYGMGEEWDRLPQVLKSRIKIDKVLDWVQRKRQGGVEFIKKSDDAGLFLCEFTYYTSLAYARFKAQGKEKENGKDLGKESSLPLVQFVHVPPVGYPYTLPELTQALRLIIWAIVNEGGI